LQLLSEKYYEMDLACIEDLAAPAFCEMGIEEVDGVPLKRALSTYIFNYENEKREKEKKKENNRIHHFEDWVVDFVLRVQHMFFVARIQASKTKSNPNPLDLLYGVLLVATKLYLDDLSFYTTLDQYHRMINYCTYTKDRIKKAESLAFDLLMTSSPQWPVFLATRYDAFLLRSHLVYHSKPATRKRPAEQESCSKLSLSHPKKKNLKIKKTLFSYFDKRDQS